MLLKRMSEASGLPGQEWEIRDIIKDELKARNIEFATDALGNVIAHVPGSGPKVMLAAHMDEVGLVITGFDRSGLLKLRVIGGIDERILVSKTVVIGKDKVKGVIGAKAIHLQEPEERERPLKVDSLFIDIGASSKEDAQKMVKLGDGAVFATGFEYFGDGMMKGKAFDDRSGCYMILESLAPQPKLDLYGVFTVQEEIGTRGAWVSAYSVAPDFAIVLECTSASDVPGTKEHEQSTELGKGPVISFMDQSMIANPAVLRFVLNAAEELGIDYQFKRAVVGGTDGGRISLTKEGIPTVVISLPCRYIHSTAGILCRKDLDNTIALVNGILRYLNERGLPM